LAASYSPASRPLDDLTVAEMKSNPLEKTVRRIGLAATVASVALLALSSPLALAASPNAQKQGLQMQFQQQPQFQQQQQHQQPRQQNNRVNQMQM
jgi:hypothetical protein